MTDESGEASDLVEGDGTPVGGELVVAAPFGSGVAVGGAAFSGLLDEARLEEAVDRAVEGAGAHADRAVAELFDPPHQGVAVELAVEERQRHVHGRCGQRLLLRLHTRSLMYRTMTVKSPKIRRWAAAS